MDRNLSLMAEVMTEETTDDAFYSTPDGGEEAVVEETDETASVDEVEAANPTALLPKTALGTNPKPGDTITVKVLKVFDDEVSVELSSKSKDKEETKSADMELDEMASD